MNNFGVIEVAGVVTKATPGWAYVPDTGPSIPNLQPANRKRAARNVPGASFADLTARQETKLRKDLEALSRDNPRDANIPIPSRPGGSRAQNKHTPNVRKILQSQKTFANHLDDFQAMLALAESNPAAAAAMNPAHHQTKASNPAASAAAKSASPAPTPPATGAAGGGAGTSKRAAAAAKRAAAKEKEEERKRAKLAAAAAAKPEPEPVQEDVEMVDAEQAQPQPQAAEEAPEQTEKEKDQPPQSYPQDGTILPAYIKPPPPKHPGDDDPLLVSYVPPFPSDEELRALMTAPPLNYFEARAQWREDEEGKYPIRVFCEVCGYWGRVKCMKCGLRVCALDCLETHREECVTRYGL